MNPPFKINDTELFINIRQVVQRVETDLKELNNTGVLFVPEIYLAFEIGKSMYKNRLTIFGVDDIKWKREENLGNGGPSDIIFEYQKETFVFELKIMSNQGSYERDIWKLQKLKNSDERSYQTYFIGLIDMWENSINDARYNYLEQTTSIQKVDGFHFNVNYPSKIKSLVCFLGVYEVLR